MRLPEYSEAATSLLALNNKAENDEPSTVILRLIIRAATAQWASLMARRAWTTSCFVTPSEI